MPQGEKDQVDRNADMIVNIKDNTNLVDFILVQDHHIMQANGKPKGMSLPTEETFRPLINTAIVNTVSINMDWCRVVKRSIITKEGLPLLTLNYGYPDGVDIFRDCISGQSTPQVTYNTYPSVDLIRKYGITVFIHAGFKGIPPAILARGLKGGSDDMKGDFEVVECRTLKQEGKEDCRILSLDCSKEFLEYLATKTRNQRTLSSL